MNRPRGCVLPNPRHHRGKSSTLRAVFSRGLEGMAVALCPGLGYGNYTPVHPKVVYMCWSSSRTPTGLGPRMGSSVVYGFQSTSSSWYVKVLHTAEELVNHLTTTTCARPASW